MNVSRSLSTVAMAATAALSMSALAAAPAHAGGAPILGTVTVDRVAVLTADAVTLTGTYTCTGADPGASRGSLHTELATRDAVGSTAATSVVCDGFSHRWTTTGPRENLTRGSATVLVSLEVCDASGDCPWNLFDARVTVTGRG